MTADDNATEEDNINWQTNADNCHVAHVTETSQMWTRDGLTYGGDLWQERHSHPPNRTASEVNRNQLLKTDFHDMIWYFCLIHNVSDQRTQQNIELLILFLQKLFRCLKLELPDRHSRTSALLTTSKTLDLRRSLHQVALTWRKWDDATRWGKSTVTNLEVLL